MANITTIYVKSGVAPVNAKGEEGDIVTMTGQYNVTPETTVGELKSKFINEHYTKSGQPIGDLKMNLYFNSQKLLDRQLVKTIPDIAQESTLWIREDMSGGKKRKSQRKSQRKGQRKSQRKGQRKSQRKSQRK